MSDVFDPDKNARNILKHGLSFQDVFGFDFETALIIPDTRYNYGEDRKIAYGYVEERLHVLVFVVRNSKKRLISFRRANVREEKFYEKNRP